MKTIFSTYLLEGKAPKPSAKYAVEIRAILVTLKRAGFKSHAMTTLDKFTNKFGKQFGLRFFYRSGGTIHSVRFNWSVSGTISDITSVDLWTANSRLDYDKPTFHINIVGTPDTVITKIKPMLKGASLGKHMIKEDEDVNVQNGVIETADTIDFDSPTFKKYELDLKRLESLLYTVIEHKPVKDDDGKIVGINKLPTRASNAILITGRGGVGKTWNVTKSLNNVGFAQIGPKEKEKAIHEITFSDGPAGTHSIRYQDGQPVFLDKSKKVLQVGLASTSNAKDYVLIKGSASPAEIYQQMFKYQHSIFVFDDADTIFDTQEGRNLFKAATDTYPKRTLSWAKKNADFFDPASVDQVEYNELVKSGKYPKTFDFSGSIIFISNLALDKIDPDGALRTRMFVIDVSPSNTDIVTMMYRIAPGIVIPGLPNAGQLRDKIIVQVINLIKTKPSLSLRTLERALKLYVTMADDPEMAIETIKLYA